MKELLSLIVYGVGVPFLPCFFRLKRVCGYFRRVLRHVAALRRHNGPLPRVNLFFGMESGSPWSVRRGRATIWHHGHHAPHAKLYSYRIAWEP